MADREEIKEIVEEIMEEIIDERVAEAVRDLIRCGDLSLSMPEPEIDDDDWDDELRVLERMTFVMRLRTVRMQ